MVEAVHKVGTFTLLLMSKCSAEPLFLEGSPKPASVAHGLMSTSESNQSRFVLAVLTCFVLLHSALAARVGHPRISRTSHEVKHDKNAVITFAIDNSGELYINGVSVESITNWQQVKTLDVYLEEGDTISIIARDYDRWFGVIVDITYKPRDSDRVLRYVTGSGNWKAVKEFDLKHYGKQKAWMTSDYSTCQWPKAHVVHPKDNVLVKGMAPSFQYESSNAKYIWASNANKKDTVFLRLTIGGETCRGQAESVQQWKKAKGIASGEDQERTDVTQEKKQKSAGAGKKSSGSRKQKKENSTKKGRSSEGSSKKNKKGSGVRGAGNTGKTGTEAGAEDLDSDSGAENAESNLSSSPSSSPTATPSPAHTLDNGQIEGQGESNMDDFCPCRIVEGPQSQCWEYELNSKSRCKPRPCGDKYECDTSGEEHLPVCMRRIMKERIVPQEPEEGLCTTEPMTSGQIFYVLYMMPDGAVGV